MNFSRSLTASRNNLSPMSEDQMRRVAPSIFAAEAHDSRSARYTYIPTSDVLAGLQREGFAVVHAQQARCRDAGRAEHTKHMIRLRHGSTAMATNVGDETHEVVLVNSHDGTSSYQMFAGVFRLVCSNGLMVGRGNVEEIRVPHKGDVSGRVIEGAYKVLEQIPAVSDSIGGMKEVRLTDGMQRAFATAALALRWEPEAAPIQAEQLLRARRSEDRAADVWTTFNRVQEGLIRGGIHGVNANNGRMTTREVKGVDQTVGLNRALWTLAEEMRKLAA